MGLFDFFKSKSRKTKDEIDSDSFFEEMKKQMELLRDEEGTELEELPNGEGEFGLSPNNPIPFSSIPDSREYLGRLVYIKPGSSQYSWERAGSLQNKILKTPVDQYNLLDLDSNVVKTIYIWTYNKVNSKKAPEGFGLMDL
ncbi:hypothetical protein [Olleya sp. YS]|uniref:hypothetical protein n=1 Tax=Olleya sp. YS TaxID=3028318 RepID=UPI0024344E5B|nr:hypothetical protein [Olleya sp. YS]WGD34024.1 hypothetical protein Ollyesu_09550 [Olleya sp. YS]